MPIQNTDQVLAGLREEETKLKKQLTERQAQLDATQASLKRLQAAIGALTEPTTTATKKKPPYT